MRIAIVTGASSGMGMEMVRQIPYLYKNLDEIWVIARRKERLFSLAKQVILPLRIFEGDLSTDQIFDQLEAAFRKEQPDVRMLVNAAGFGKSGNFCDIVQKDDTVLLEMIDLNCRALTKMITISISYMNKGSRIINLASAAAFCPQPSFAVYAATKAYVDRFSKALSAELKSKNIYVTSVCPGPVNTEFFQISGGVATSIKKRCMASPKAVVYRALQDSKAKKERSVYGITMKLSKGLAKRLPENWVIWFFTIQQKDKESTR